MRGVACLFPLLHRHGVGDLCLGLLGLDLDLPDGDAVEGRGVDSVGGAEGVRLQLLPLALEVDLGDLPSLLLGPARRA